jgi:hypothetical protein
MSNLFTISDLLCITSSINELLYMSESPICPEIYYTDNSIKICLRLKNGRSDVTIGTQYGCFSYIDDNEATLTSAQFTNDAITDINGSFHKAFRQIRAFDREYASQAKITDTSIDRASFGLTEVN